LGSCSLIVEVQYIRGTTEYRGVFFHATYRGAKSMAPLNTTLTTVPLKCLSLPSFDLGIFPLTCSWLIVASQLVTVLTALLHMKFAICRRKSVCSV